MDHIVRFFWIAWDNTNGTEDEEIFKDKMAALHFFDKLTVPYKKIVACYNDHDETLMIHRRLF